MAIECLLMTIIRHELPFMATRGFNSNLIASKWQCTTIKWPSNGHEWPLMVTNGYLRNSIEKQLFAWPLMATPPIFCPRARH